MNSGTRWTVFACAALALSCVSTARAYDAETHALITYRAYQASVLAQTGASSTVTRLGLDRFDIPTPFNTYWQAIGSALGPISYYDNNSSFDTNTYALQPNEYERCQMENLAKVSVPLSNTGWYDSHDPMLTGSTVTFFPIHNWLMRGVLREDDLTSLAYGTIARSGCGKPDPDRYDQANGDVIHGVRVLNHFYDPVHDLPLSAGAACGFAPSGQCLKSVDWALGYVDSFATAPVVDTLRRNHFTYADARENMWRALTGERNRSAPLYTVALRNRCAGALVPMGDHIPLTGRHDSPVARRRITAACTQRSSQRYEQCGATSFRGLYQCARAQADGRENERICSRFLCASG